jgi:hypothetical protein
MNADLRDVSEHAETSSGDNFFSDRSVMESRMSEKGKKRQREKKDAAYTDDVGNISKAPSEKKIKAVDELCIENSTNYTRVKSTGLSDTLVTFADPIKASDDAEHVTNLSLSTSSSKLPMVWAEVRHVTQYTDIWKVLH